MDPGATAWPMVRAWMDRRAEFRFRGCDWVVIQLNTGRVEIYLVDEDGLEMFKGYADERDLSGAVRVAALGAVTGPGAWVRPWSRGGHEGMAVR